VRNQELSSKKFDDGHEFLPIMRQYTGNRPAFSAVKMLSDIAPLNQIRETVRDLVKLMSTLVEGATAPNFVARDQDGNEVSLADLRGSKVVLYFYPKDDTPGCTKEACSFRDADDVYAKKGIKVFGVSTDSEKSHQKFISKYSLPFTLLADTDKKIVNDYGVYGEKSLYGRKYMGVNRMTFLIDEDGKIVKVFKKVNVSEHATEVLEAFGD
jgi:peroxiredoxin Q/BCP